MEISKLLRDEPYIPTIGYLYATRCSAYPNKIKIGKANDMKQKLSQLNVAFAPHKHVVVALAESFDNERDERTVHAFFSAYRREGDWFEISAKKVKQFFEACITATHQREMQAYKFQEEDWFGVEDDKAPVPVPNKLSSTELFLLNLSKENLKNNIEVAKLSGKALYNKYVHYAQAHEYQEIQTFNAFGLELKQIDGVSVRLLTDIDVTCILEFEEIKAYLIQRRKLSVIETFMLEFANKHNDLKKCKLLADELYEKYQLFVEERQMKEIETRKQFCMDLEWIEGVETQQMSGRTRYTLNIAEIKEYLEG
jgi:hypothetical protein